MTRAAKSETSAGGVVYRIESGRPVYLLIRDGYRNWGFPKGHLEAGEEPEAAARREVTEETGLSEVSMRGHIDTIDWHFRLRGREIHKTCHFYLMEAATVETAPQRAEGITACRWCAYDAASRLLSYRNAKGVLRRARDMVAEMAVVP